MTNVQLEQLQSQIAELTKQLEAKDKMLAQKQQFQRPRTMAEIIANGGNVNVIDTAVATHHNICPSGKGINVFLKSAKHSVSYRRFVPNRHINKVVLGKTYNVCAYKGRSSGKTSALIQFGGYRTFGKLPQ